MIGGQKWKVILKMPWLACHNPEIDWKTGEVKIMRYPEECGKQWRLKQEKPGWQKQKEEEVNQEAEKKQEERKGKKQKKKQKKEKTIEVKRVAEGWEIWDEEKEAVKLEIEVKKLVLEKFHKWIKVFGKKQIEQIPTRKI